MGFEIIETSAEDRIKHDEWSEKNISGVEVLKEFTIQIENNKFERILVGTKSIKYRACSLTFITESGKECFVNIADIYYNEDYFKKIPI